MPTGHYTVEKTPISAKHVSGIQLSNTAKIIIGVVVGLVVLGAIIGTVAYFVSVKKKNHGTTKFGTLQVTDTTTNASGIVKPNDVLQLKFNPNPGGGFSGLANWSVSLDNGQNFSTLATDQAGNTYKYTVPDDICSDAMVFKVTDSKLTQDFVESDSYAVRPTLRITDGPGMQSGTTVYTSSSVVITLDYDDDLDLNAVGDWRIDISSDSAFSSPVQQTASSFNATTKQLTWKPTQAATSVYMRVSTTSNIGSCTNASFTITPYTFNVVNAIAACAGNVFVVCSVIVTSASMIEQSSFLPEEQVLIKVVYPPGTYTGDGTDMVIAYVVDNATPVTISVTGSNSASTSTFTYNWTIPESMFTNSMQIKVTRGTATGLSTAYIVQPGIVIDTFGTTGVSVTTPNLPIFHTITTTVHVLPVGYADFTTWLVGIGDANSASLYIPVISATYTSTTPRQCNLVWVFTISQLGLQKVGDTVQKYIYFKATNANGSTIVRETEVCTFSYVNWVPTYAPFNGQVITTGTPISIAYNPNTPTTIPCNVSTATPTNTEYWFPIDVNTATNETRICNYNPAQPPATSSDIMCLGDVPAGYVPPVTLAGAPLVALSHISNSTTYPICATTTTALVVQGPSSIAQYLSNVAGGVCNGTFEIGASFNWSVNPFF